ncbi:hypothetical protein D3C76_1543290 [compost metagenome]
MIIERTHSAADIFATFRPFVPLNIAVAVFQARGPVHKVEIGNILTRENTNEFAARSQNFVFLAAVQVDL